MTQNVSWKRTSEKSIRISQNLFSRSTEDAFKMENESVFADMSRIGIQLHCRTHPVLKIIPFYCPLGRRPRGSTGD